MGDGRKQRAFWVSVATTTLLWWLWLAMVGGLMLLWGWCWG